MLQNNKELLNEKENISKPNEETLDENSLQKYARRTTWVFLGLVFSAILLVMKEFTPDSDAWFLAATGRYIVENQQVPVINPFTIHEGYSIIV